MAQDVVTLSFTWRLPFWWRLYIGALKFFHGLGLLEVDVEVAAQFVAKRIRVYIVTSDGRWKRV
jgi:hypothetical protein